MSTRPFAPSHLGRLGRWLRPLRDPHSMWRIERCVGWLMLMFVGSFVASLVAPVRAFMMDHLALVPQAVMSGKAVWQLLTAMFTHINLAEAVFSALFLWLMGSFLERTIGRARFLRFFFVTGIAGNLCFALVATLLKHDRYIVGIDASLFALMISSGILYGRQQVQVFGAMGARADVVSGIFGGLWLLRHLLEGDFPMVSLDVGAGLTAWLLLRQHRIGSGRGMISLRNIKEKRRTRNRFEVLEGGKPPEKKWLN